MVQQYKSRSQFDIPYSSLCPVYFYRYPNPKATHVLSVDVLSRELIKRPIRRLSLQKTPDQYDIEQGEGDFQHVLKTTRLILKSGTLPRWAPAGMLKKAESWVLEESEVELDSLNPDLLKSRKGIGREMRSWTRNLDHTNLLAVTESTTFKEKIHNEEESSVLLKSMYDVTSSWSFTLLRNRIEKFGLNRVVTHVDSSREGILSTYARLLEERSGISAGMSAFDSADLSLEAGKVSKRARLRAALRPPFLDGDFVGPIARMKSRLMGVRAWWRGLDRGGSGSQGLPSKNHEDFNKGDENHLSPTERIRKRFLFLRDQSRAAFNTQQDDTNEE